MKLPLPLFQADQEFVAPFGGNFFQIQPSVKSTSVMSKAQDLQETSQVTTQTSNYTKNVPMQ